MAQKRKRAFNSNMILGLALICPLALTAITPVRAEGPVLEISDVRPASLKVVLGKSQTLRTNRGFVDLVVGNPDIADVMPLNDRTLYVLGKKNGVTNVSVFDADKRLVGVIDVEITADAPRLAAAIERADFRNEARIGTANGRTVLSGSAPDAVAAAQAAALAKGFGGEVLNQMQVHSTQQVMLEVRFVEASRNAGRELGIQWDVVGRNFGSATTAARNISIATGLGALPSGDAPFGTIIGRVLSSGVEADILVRALEDRGLARRLAEPNLVAMSGEKASFLAGGEFPVPVQNSNGQVSIEFKKFGVGLQFTPIVLDKGNIYLKIEPEVSQLDMTNVIRLSGIAIPSLVVRRANTAVQLKDGQSFAIAGLLQSVNTTTQQQLPWLGDVPIIGALFRSAAFEKRETDLAIIVTPRLVKPAKPGERLRTPFDGVLPANDVDLFMAGKSEVPASKGRDGINTPLPSPGGHILDFAPRVTRASYTSSLGSPAVPVEAPRPDFKARPFEVGMQGKDAEGN